MSSQVTKEITIELEPLLPEKKALSQDMLLENAGVTRLPVPHFMQENTLSWCYAACAQMILAAYKKPVSQCEIVGSVKKKDCCHNPAPSVCVDEGCDHVDIAPIYNSRGISAVRHQPHGRISLTELQNELLAKKPVEVTRQAIGLDNSFHAIIVRGFKGKLLFINDPLEKPVGGGIDYTLMTYDELVDDNSYTWDETWTGFPSIK